MSIYDILSEITLSLYGKVPSKVKKGKETLEIDDDFLLARAQLNKNNYNTAAKYLDDIYFHLVAQEKRTKQKENILELTLQVMEHLYINALSSSSKEVEEYDLLFNLLIDLYQAELAGVFKLSPEQKAFTAKFKIPLNKLSKRYQELYGYAKEGNGYSFYYEDYVEKGGKSQRYSGVVGMNETTYDSMTMFIMGLLFAESDFDQKKINRTTGCTGLMQLDPNTSRKMIDLIGKSAQYYKEEISFLFNWSKDARPNIILGVVYLRYLMLHFNNVLISNVQKENDNVLILSLFSYNGKNGEANIYVKGFVERLNKGEKIDWFGQKFKQSYPGWWHYIVKIIGAHRASINHLI